MCETQHDLTKPLAVQIEQLYHNINTWRTGATVMKDRYGTECAALGLADTLEAIAKGCAELAEKAITLYTGLQAPGACATVAVRVPGVHGSDVDGYFDSLGRG
jgi:hypothetical protein